MSFRHIFSLRSIVLFSVNESCSSLSRLSPGSSFSSLLKNKCYKHSYSPLASLDVRRQPTESNLVPFWGYEKQTILNTSPIFLCQERFVHRGRARYSETSKSTPEEKKDEIPPKKMNVFQKFKAMYRDYWYVLVPVHLVTSAFFYGSFYYMAKTGVDVAALAEWAHFGEETVDKIRKSGNSLTGHLAIAYLLYKVMTPIRYTVTIGGTTVSINYLKKWGLIKPMPKRGELRKMFDDKKVELRKKRESLRERKEVMKKTVLSKLPSKKRMKNTSDFVKKMLSRKRNLRRG